MPYVIEFFCQDGDAPFEIGLEPEGMVFEIRPGDRIRFVAKTDDPGFYWAANVSDSGTVVSLFTEGTAFTGALCDVEVRRNGVVIW